MCILQTSTVKSVESLALIVIAHLKVLCRYHRDKFLDFLDSPSIKGFQVSWSEFGLSFSLEPGRLARELVSVLPSWFPLEDREARVS